MVSAEYTVKLIQGCKVVYGDVPVADFAALMMTMPKGAIVDAKAGHHLGAVFAAGMPEDTAKLLELPPCREIQEQAEIARQHGMSEQAIGWLTHGDKSRAGKAMFSALLGFPVGDRYRDSYPYYPEELGDCRRLLEQVPELAPRLGEMANVSREWAALVSKWDELCALMDDEAPAWRDRVGDSPKTHALMLRCIADSRSSGSLDSE